MADLKYIEKQSLEHGLGMPSGYVLDFNNEQFRAFIQESTGLNIEDPKYTEVGSSNSKAKRLRKFLASEPNHVVGKLILDLVEYSSTLEIAPKPDVMERCRKIAARLLGGETSVSVVCALRWDALDADAFERLVFNLFQNVRGYQNPQWLTPTNAQDRGRDISVERTVVDTLSGTRTFRVIVQCKHWRTKSIGISEVSTLLAQMTMWEPPKVSELIIATSGRFAIDAVTFIENHNRDHKSPFIYMWPESHLEALLVERPNLIREFGLRD